jgi:hypothetical protein
MAGSFFAPYNRAKYLRLFLHKCYLEVDKEAETLGARSCLLPYTVSLFVVDVKGKTLPPSLSLVDQRRNTIFDEVGEAHHSTSFVHF